ncbi:hypothetical protein H0H93_003107, partial [Arthromyces matolae]
FVLETAIQNATLGYALWTPFSKDMFGESPQLLRHIHTNKRAASGSDMDNFWQQIGPNLFPRSFNHAITIMVDPQTIDLSTLTFNARNVAFVEFWPEFKGLALTNAKPFQLPYLPILLDGAKRLDLYTQYLHADFYAEYNAAHIAHIFHDMEDKETATRCNEHLHNVVDQAMQHGWVARFVNRGNQIIMDATLGYAFWTPFSKDMFGMSPELVYHRHNTKQAPLSTELDDLWELIGPALDPHCAKYAITIMVDPSTIYQDSITNNPNDAYFVQFRSIWKGVQISKASPSQLPHLPVLLDGEKRLDLYVQYLQKDLFDQLKKTSFICQWAPPGVPLEKRKQFEMEYMEQVKKAEDHGWIARFINRDIIFQSENPDAVIQHLSQYD